MCPPNMKKITAADVILVSHGHSDHTSDVPAVSRATNAPIVAIYELALWFERKGLANVQGMGIGGTVNVAGLRDLDGSGRPLQQRRRERDERVSRPAGRIRRAHGG